MGINDQNNDGSQVNEDSGRTNRATTDRLFGNGFPGNQFERPLGDDPDVTYPVYKFRHKTIRHYKLGRFEFRDFELTLKGKNSDKDREEFLNLVSDPRYPSNERNQLFEVNVQAERDSEMSLQQRMRRPSDTVVRGPMAASDIKTRKDFDSVEATADTANRTQPKSGDGSGPLIRGTSTADAANAAPAIQPFKP